MLPAPPGAEADNAVPDPETGFVTVGGSSSDGFVCRWVTTERGPVAVRYRAAPRDALEPAPASPASPVPTIVTFPDLAFDSLVCYNSLLNYPDLVEGLHAFAILHVEFPGCEPPDLAATRPGAGSTSQSAGSAAPPTATVRGAGASDLPYRSVDDLSACLDPILAAYSINHYIGLGIGLGATTLLDHALKNRDRCLGLILASFSASRASWVEWASARFAFVPWLQVWGLTPYLEEEWIAASLSHNQAGSSDSPIRAYVQAVLKQRKPALLQRYYEIQLARPHLLGSLAAFPRSILVLAPKDSPFYEPCLEAASAGNPQQLTLMRLDTTGHMAFLESPQTIAMPILLFLQGLALPVSVPTPEGNTPPRRKGPR